jgi:uncharacterized protein
VTKIFLSYLLTLFSISLTCCGQKDKKVPTPSYHSLIPEKPIGWVSDFEKIFTIEQAFYLDSIINRHEVETTNEIALVTLLLDSFQIKTPEDFGKVSLTLFKQWGIGKKDKKNGIGILISNKLRKIRIEIGYGLVSKLTDEESQKIIDAIILPEFKKDNYYAGVLNGLQAILKEIE